VTGAVVRSVAVAGVGDEHCIFPQALAIAFAVFFYIPESLQMDIFSEFLVM